MGFALILAIVTFVVTAASTAYQVIQAKKMKKQAQAAADARKGFELVVEGSPDWLPIVYGRALVGGIRSWAETTSNYRYSANNSDQVFMTGSGGVGAYNYNYTYWDYDYAIEPTYGRLVATGGTAFAGAQASGYMNQSLSGDRNEFLCYQQALCVAPINGVRDVIIDNGRYLDDPLLGTYGKIESGSSKKTVNGVKAALRFDYHNKGTPVPDTIAANNFPKRSNALYDGMAWMTAWFRLDRDEPQFSGIPSVQSLIEGRLVRWVTGGELSTTLNYLDDPTKYAYSNSGPLCLLDYMLDKENGGGYELDEIDFDSFEECHNVGSPIIQAGVTVGGKFWNPTNGIGWVNTRDLPLYECNIIIDTKKPVRDNIEALLSTMGDARLVWSNGKYSLNMQYPETNDDISYVTEITDDDLVLGESIGIKFPDAESRYNFCTVRFHNEFENFTEDSVSWPPRYDAEYQRGIGARNYSTGVGSWNDAKAGGRLLNECAVWNGSGTTANFTWKLNITADTAGVYTLDAICDDYFTITITNSVGGVVATLNDPGGNLNENTVFTTGVTLAAGVYTITATGHSNTTEDVDKKGFAGKLYNGTRVIWSSRSTSYTNFITITEDSAVYNAMLLEDNGAELETSVFADGITDPYHALAKAEELVRSSRTATGYTFSMNILDRYLQPGDFIKFRSVEANIGVDVALYMRVNTVKINPNDDKAETCEVTATRFDASQLAWNVKDNAYISPENTYKIPVPQPSELAYIASTASQVQSSGRLLVAPVGFGELGAYVFYMHRPTIDPLDADGRPVYIEIGRNPEPFFDLVPITAPSAFFGVRTASTGGSLSAMTVIDHLNATTLVHNWLREAYIKTDFDTFNKFDATTFLPTTITLTAKQTNFVSPVYQWSLNGVVVGTAATLIVNAFDNSSSRRYILKVSESSDPTGLIVQDEKVIYSQNYGEPGATVGSLDIVLTSVGTTPVTINGNKITQSAGSSWNGLVREQNLVAGAMIATMDVAATGVTALGLDTALTGNSSGDQEINVQYLPGGMLYIYRNGTLIASFSVGALSKIYVAYDGNRYRVWGNGTEYCANITTYPGMAATYGLSHVAKWFAYTLGVTYTGLRYGPYSNEALSRDAQATATAAQNAANAATALLTDIASDGLLTADEKPAVIKEYNTIIAEQSGIDGQATSYAITTEKTNYDTAVSTLTSYLGGLNTPTLWSTIPGNTTVVGTTFRANFVDVYTKRQILLNKIAAVAGTRAVVTGGNVVDGNGNPLTVDIIRNNMAIVEWWRAGATVPWTKYAANTINDIYTFPNATYPNVYGPSGTQADLWWAKDTDGGGKGGWSPGDNAPLDPTKTYMFAQPFMRLTGSAASVISHGPSGTVCTLNTTTSNPNLYFSYPNYAFTLGKWYVAIGFIYPAGSTGKSSDNAGVYEMDTGNKVANGTNVCFQAGNGNVHHKVEVYGSAETVETLFDIPLVEMVDGGRSNLIRLLSPQAVTNITQRYSDIVSGYGRPSDNAGTSIVLTHSGGQVQVGNGANKPAGTTAGWNSRSYTEPYLGAAYWSAKCTLAGNVCSFGFWRNGYSSGNFFTDFCGIYNAAGAYYLYEEGNLRVTLGSSYNGVTFTDNTLWQGTYDGYKRRYFADGVLMWESTTATTSPSVTYGSTYRFVAQFSTAGTGTITEIQFGPYTDRNWNNIAGDNLPANNAGTTLSLLKSGTDNSTIQGNSITINSAGGASWGSNIYSNESFNGTAYITCSSTSNASGNGCTVGLATTANKSATGYSSVSYGMYFWGGTNVWYAINGSSGALATGVTSTDIFGITYDGVNVKYWRNGAVIMTVAATSGLTLHPKILSDTSSATSTVTGLQFGAYTGNNWGNIAGIGRPSDNAGTTLTMESYTASQYNIIGNTAIKITSNAGYRNAWSKEWFVGGCQASGQILSPYAGIGIAGVKADGATVFTHSVIRGSPQTDVYWYEGASNGLLQAGVASTATFQITDDGVNVKYYIDGVLKRTVASAAGTTRYLGVCAGDPNTTFTNLQFSPFTNNNFSGIGGDTRPSDNATTDLRVTSIGSTAVTIVGNTFVRSTGASDYNACVRSEPQLNTIWAEVDTKVSGNTLIALDDDATSTGYASMNIQVQYSAGGTTVIYMAGTGVWSGNLTAYAGKKLAICYDGVRYRIYIDGVTPVGASFNAASGLKLWAKWHYYDAAGTAMTGLKSGATNNAYWGEIGGITQLLLGPANVTNLDPTYTVGGSDVTVNLPSHTRRVAGPSGAVTLSYGAMSGVVAFNAYWTAYVDDPYLQGIASPTATFTTNPDDLLIYGRYQVSSGVAPSSGGTGGGVGGGGGGGSNWDGCVEYNSHMPDGRMAGHYKAGDDILVLDDDNRDNTKWVKVLGNKPTSQNCYEIISASGIILRLSDSTPCTLYDGTTVLPSELEGHKLAVQDEDGFRWEEIVSVEEIGPRIVAHLSCNEGTYAAGAEPGRYIFTHNIYYKP